MNLETIWKYFISLDDLIQLILFVFIMLIIKDIFKYIFQRKCKCKGNFIQLNDEEFLELLKSKTNQ